MKRINVGLKSEISVYLRIIDRSYFQSTDFLIDVSKVFVLLENPGFEIP